MRHKATETQLKIFEFVKKGKGNGIIHAVAGDGKPPINLQGILQSKR